MAKTNKNNIPERLFTVNDFLRDIGAPARKERMQAIADSQPILYSSRDGFATGGLEALYSRNPALHGHANTLMTVAYEQFLNHCEPVSALLMSGEAYFIFSETRARKEYRTDWKDKALVALSEVGNCNQDITKVMTSGYASPLMQFILSKNTAQSALKHLNGIKNFKE